MTVETLDDLFSDDSMPQTAVDEELFELCTKFENAFHQCIPREMMPLWVTDEKLKEAMQEFANSTWTPAAWSCCSGMGE